MTNDNELAEPQAQTDMQNRAISIQKQEIDDLKGQPVPTRKGRARLHLRRRPMLVLTSATLALTLSSGLTPASATGPNRSPDVLEGHAFSGSLRPAVVFAGADLPGLTGTHYVYADDGLSSNNTIDEFTVTGSKLTYLGTVPTGGSQFAQAGGYNDIAVHGACLVHSDSGGSIQSYSINVSGALFQVSTLAVNRSSGFPGDTKISANGQDAYVTAYTTTGGGSLISLPLSSTCVLGTPVFFTVPFSDTYFSIALPDATHLLAVNNGAQNGFIGANDIYTITGGVTLTLEKSNPSSIVLPDGAATGSVAGHMYTFNGQNAAGQPQAEADSYAPATGSLSSAPGSPQTDGNTNDFAGASVYFAPTFALLTQVFQGTNTVAAYSLAGGTFAYKDSVPLDPTSLSGAVSQASLSQYLGVLSGNGRIDACQLATSGVSSCVLEATLTGAGAPGAVPGGLGVK